MPLKKGFPQSQYFVFLMVFATYPLWGTLEEKTMEATSQAQQEFLATF